MEPLRHWRFLATCTVCSSGPLTCSSSQSYHLSSKGTARRTRQVAEPLQLNVRVDGMGPKCQNDIDKCFKWFQFRRLGVVLDESAAAEGFFLLCLPRLRDLLSGDDSHSFLSCCLLPAFFSSRHERKQIRFAALSFVVVAEVNFGIQLMYVTRIHKINRPETLPIMN